MSLFRYEAVDRSGKVVRGVMDAGSEQQVAQKLGTMGYSPRAVYNTSTPPVQQSPVSSAVPQQSQTVARGGIACVTLPNGVPVSIKSSVPASSLAIFFRQMATLIRSGHPIYQASTIMRVSNRKLRAILLVIQERVKNGQRLSGAMAEFPGVFPVHVIASVWCGELAGKLDKALDDVASGFEREAADTLQGRVGWGITKIGVILVIFLLPLADFNKLLHSVAGQGVKAVAAYFGQSFMMMLPFAIAVVLSWSIWGVLKRVHVIRYALDTLILKVPVWGKLHRYRAIAQFTQSLDQLLNAGIYPTTAWEAAALTPRNSVVAAKLKLARPKSSNDGIVELIERSGIFDRDDLGLIIAGQQSGSLPEIMGNLSTNYASRADAARSIGKTWSLSLMILAQIVMAGVIVIMVALGYRNYLAPLLDSAGF